MTAARGERLRGVGGSLASVAAPAASVDSWLLPVAGLLVLTVLGLFVVLRVRSRVHGRAELGGAGFSLEELDELRSRGELSDAQWHAARRVVLDRLRSSTASAEVRERP
jgi:hypothetical protein